MAVRTISIGGATYDLFVRTAHSAIHDLDDQPVLTLPLGEKVKIHNVEERCGGGASNSAVGLSRLGCQAEFCGILGDDQWGEKMILHLKDENVGTSCTTIVEHEVSSFSIILQTDSGERVILYEPGTNEHLHDANFNREVAAQMDWVYLNRIQESSCVIQDDIVDIIAGNQDTKLTWNPGGCQIDTGMNEVHHRTLLKHTTLLFLNKEEALGFMRTTDTKDALKALVQAGVECVCITDGARGSIATDGTHLYTCPVVPHVDIVDSTGAGDAFGTAMTWALSNQHSLPDALRAGTLNAASVVTNIGAQPGLLTNIEMQTQLENTVLDVDTQPLV